MIEKIELLGRFWTGRRVDSHNAEGRISATTLAQEIYPFSDRSPFEPPSYGSMAPKRTNFFYDLALWIFNIMLDVFFKEIRPRGSHRIPREGPVIFVVAPHVNQVSTSITYFTNTD
jgi:hypothetical protein